MTGSSHRLDRRGGVGAGGLHHLGHQPVERDRLRCDGGVGVGARQVEQVDDETLEALDLGQHAGLGRHRIGAARVGQVDLELRPHAGQGRA